MNLTFVKLKGVVAELKNIGHQLSRLADCWETELSQSGINVRPPKADVSGPPPTIDYTEEEMDWMREQIDHIRREDERKLREEQENAE